MTIVASNARCDYLEGTAQTAIGVADGVEAVLGAGGGLVLAVHKDLDALHWNPVKHSQLSASDFSRECCVSWHEPTVQDDRIAAWC